MRATETGQPPKPTPDITIRPLSGEQDHKACIRLQRETWGQDFTESVPRTILMIVGEKTGGVVAGAFDGDRLVGFVLGISGIVRGRPTHWSHLLAVSRAYRGAGLGRKLKLFQREWLLANGVDVAYWTFDPLQAGNAHLNFNRLGVQAERYVEDFYGTDTNSELHAPLGTDRLVVRWDLDSDRVSGILAAGGRADPDQFRPVPAINVVLDAEHRPVPRVATFPAELIVRIEVPCDLQACKEESVERALAWRTSTRAAFRWYLDRKYRITDVYRDPQEHRCYYVLRAESGGR